ncbi:hypothetical protein DSM25559_5465 [Agrobacterium rosae]|uniref:Uncharacterized protein n=1 Tax=Agrobacterium rosae TaxID=1972867 RepID=A0A1R3U9X9_9HYPH|nr:hypothetical protein DSM25559_5465 [Agrobacterium rosae]
MLSMSQQLQLRAQNVDYGIALGNFRVLSLEFRRLFSNQCTQCR